MTIIKRSNQHSNKKQRRYSNNYSAPSSNVILFYENELCSQSCTEEVKGIVSDNSIILNYQHHASDREVSSLLCPSCESSTEKNNMIEFDPLEDIYHDPLDFKRDWSQELKKKFSIQMRDLCSNLSSNESDDHLRRTKKQKRN